MCWSLLVHAPLSWSPHELQCILQYWGKRRGIYSNVMGFLGGVNFAILVARVCLHYPNACGSTIVRSFFKIFAVWTWATTAQS